MSLAIQARIAPLPVWATATPAISVKAKKPPRMNERSGW